MPDVKRMHVESAMRSRPVICESAEGIGDWWGKFFSPVACNASHIRPRASMYACKLSGLGAKADLKLLRHSGLVVLVVGGDDESQARDLCRKVTSCASIIHFISVVCLLLCTTRRLLQHYTR